MTPESPESLGSLGKDELVALVLALAGQNRVLIEQNRVLTEQVAALTARVAELEARLKIPPKTPDNSSLPPSKGQKSDCPEKVKKRRKGRPGIARALDPNPDHVRDIFAEACTRCETHVTPADQPDVHSYDHIDLPPIEPVTTRINLHSGDCPGCGERVAATAPADMPVGSPFGPGIVALVIYLHVCQMVSFNRLVEMLKGLFGLTISEGAIANMLARSAAPFAVVGKRIEAEVRGSLVIACDETSARVQGVTCWQWVFGTATAVFHRIAASRGAAVVTAFLEGARPEVWVSDRLAAQMGHAKAHQVCLSHLLRDAQFAIDAGDKIFAPGFKFLLKRACAIGRRRADLSDATLKAYQRDLERRRDRLLALDPAASPGASCNAASPRCRTSCSCSSRGAMCRRPTTSRNGTCARPSSSAKSPTAFARCGGPRSTPISAPLSQPAA